MSISRKNQKFLAAALALALLLSALTPLFSPVYADDPPPEPAAEEQDAGGAPAEEPGADEPPVDEVPADEPPLPPEQPDASPPAEELPPGDEPAEQEPSVEDPLPQEEPNGEQPLQEEPGGDADLQLDQISQSSPPVQLPDPYYYFGGTLYSYGSFADAINHMTTNDHTPDDFTLYAEAQTFVEDVTIDGTAWTNTPTTLRVVSEGNSTDTQITGIFTVQNMLNFLLQGFTITGGVSAVGNTGTLTLQDVVASNTTTDGIVVNNHDGAVILENVEANSNAGLGASIDNTAGTDGVTITDSTFNGNNTTAGDGEQGGLQVLSDGNVVLENVEASGNLDGDGASVSAQDITISGGSYNSNTSPGSGYGNGLYLYSSSTRITIDGTEARGNEENGVTAITAVEDAENLIEIKFGKFKDNGGFGAYAAPESGTVVFNCVTFASNTLGSTMVPVGETVHYVPCPCYEEKEKPEYLGVKLNDTDPTIINPGNGTLVIIPPIIKTGQDGTARAKVLALLEKELPAALLEDDFFLAGLNIMLINAVMPEDAETNEEHQITVEFYIPAYRMERSFAVLWWDEAAGEWAEVPFELIPHDRMPGGKIVVHWPEPGIFVLVEREADSE